MVKTRVDAGDVRRRPAPAGSSRRRGVGTTMMISPTPATWAGIAFISTRRRIGRLAARHVDADAVQRRDLLAQQGAVGVAVAPALAAGLLLASW